MTAPPLPTFVPQDAWYNLTTGQINPSVADVVPNVTFLHPFNTPLGMVDGLVGSLDEEILYLAGLNTRLDGGQKWLMWEADSLAVDDGVNVFCPFADATKHGRWVNTGTPSSGPGATVSVQIIPAGGTKNVVSSPTNFIKVFIKGRDQAGATTLNLPGTTFAGQEITVKDANGDATANPITLTAPSIDSATTSAITIDFGERTVTWNTTEWSAS